MCCFSVGQGCGGGKRRGGREQRRRRRRRRRRGVSGCDTQGVEQVRVHFSRASQSASIDIQGKGLTLAGSYSTPYALCPVPSVLGPTPYALYPIPYTLYPIPYTLYPIPHIFPICYALDTTPYTLSLLMSSYVNLRHEPNATLQDQAKASRRELMALTASCPPEHQVCVCVCACMCTCVFMCVCVFSHCMSEGFD
jgi:hypothetical protein